MDDTTRHERFKIAQDNTWQAAALFQEARTEADRERAYRRVMLWAQVAETLRRHT